MTPKEHAEMIIGKIQIANALIVAMPMEKSIAAAKQCAYVYCDLILKDKHNCGCEQSVTIDKKCVTYSTYWKEVKAEIELL